ncbi:hypothetical protein LJC13_00850, partial [Peptostreptococcaceae bacterium OttesenSCG-928-C18]|nr:hypothetical protein [Peptostreptococcaceae bacterium OttesenSCG-928-C18]
NRLFDKKISKRRKEELEEQEITIIGDQLINENTQKEDLYNIWEVYTGVSPYIRDRNIIERIFDL